MPKFHLFAARIAPLIDAAHVSLHAAARPGFEHPAFTPGFLVDLRYTLPLRPLTRAGLSTIYRYTKPADLAEEVAVHLAQGTLKETDALHPTPKTATFIRALYAHHEATAARIWPDVTHLAAQVARVLAAAPRQPGGALELMAPPYEPPGAAPGLLLFNRLAALRYSRADAHAAAWRAAGLTAEEVVNLREGPLHAEIEHATNVAAAEPYKILTDRERADLHTGLSALI
ncbi:hypothetical protein ACIBKY_42950 [Nonomuraea sp. NPDC050394]|uniref:hypothetical protein n=1 Tax=Nonomuraea sp. NPDC050394 TaxID=3364363 RepID=UPI0037A8E40D